MLTFDAVVTDCNSAGDTLSKYKEFYTLRTGCPQLQHLHGLEEVDVQSQRIPFEHIECYCAHQWNAQVVINGISPYFGSGSKQDADGADPERDAAEESKHDKP